MIFCVWQYSIPGEGLPTWLHCKRTIWSSRLELSWSLPYVPFPIVDFNLCLFIVINHDPEYNSFAEFCESFWQIIKPGDSLGDLSNHGYLFWKLIDHICGQLDFIFLMYICLLLVHFLNYYKFTLLFGILNYKSYTFTL